jgi:hypothetical protein
MCLIVITWIIGNAHILVSDVIGKAQHRRPICKWTDIIHMYFKEVVCKEPDELMWLRLASHCGHEDESTDNSYLRGPKALNSRNIYIQFGHVSLCVVRNVSDHIEITDLKLYVG